MRRTQQTQKVGSMNLESILKTVSALTADNEHTQARLTIAREILDNKMLSNAYDAISELNSYYGFLESNVAEIRNDLDIKLKNQINDAFDKTTALKILKCL